MIASAVRVRAFGRIREITGSEMSLEVTGDERIQSLWERLCTDHPALRALRESTRFYRNGVLAKPDEIVAPGDEVGLLPPVGGG